jgi:hypothetical protein
MILDMFKQKTDTNNKNYVLKTNGDEPLFTSSSPIRRHSVCVRQGPAYLHVYTVLTCRSVWDMLLLLLLLLES